MSGADADDRSAGTARGTLKGLAATFVGLVHTRLELLATEVEEEGLRLARLWLLATCSACFFALAVLLATLFIIVWCWDSYRLAAIGGFAVFYLVIAVMLARALRTRAGARSELFRGSLGELSKDRELLS